MAEFVYILCGLASLVCFGLLLKGYYRTRTRLLLWSSICFCGMALNNVLLFVDIVVVPEFPLGPFRVLFALVGMGFLLYGLVFETT